MDSGWPNTVPCQAVTTVTTARRLLPPSQVSTASLAARATATHTSSSPMAAPARGLALPPPLAHPSTSPRRLDPSTRGRSSRSRRRVHGVRAAAEGASRATDPVEVVGVGSRKDAVIDFCLGSRTLSSTPIRFWYGTDTEFVNRGLVRARCRACFGLQAALFCAM